MRPGPIGELGRMARAAGFLADIGRGGVGCGCRGRGAGRCADEIARRDDQRRHEKAGDDRPKRAPRWPGRSDRRSVLYAAATPELVHPAGNAELRSRCRDYDRRCRHSCRRAEHLRGPVVAEAHLFAEGSVEPDQAAHVRFLRSERVVDGVAADAELIGIEKREKHPFDQRGPFRIVLADDRPERLLRDRIRQDDCSPASVELQALGVELRHVAGDHAALAFV